MFINSILKPYEDVPNSGSMRVLRDVLSIEGVGKKNVIIRGGITKEFWQKVIDTAKKYSVCAPGSPGIGKTASTAVLIRLLLEQKHTVVYRIRTLEKDGFVYLFTPSVELAARDIDVQIVPEDKFRCTDKMFNNPSIYYVVDPGHTKDSCDLPSIYDGKVIIVTSPDVGHWGDSQFAKEGMFLYYPVWSLDELIKAKHFF